MVKKQKMKIEIDKPEDVDKVEGLEEDSLDMDGYPLDSLLIRHETRTIHDICRRIDKSQYILDPDFQRDFIWPLEKQRKLIESLLMRIPLPVFYLAERNDGKIIVVDGLQRITTIHRFINDAFSLQGLDIHGKALEGKKFKDLPPKLQTRIEDTNLIVYIVDEKVPERAKLDIFTRVNGGIPLTRQQMRNCMYVGSATILLKELANSPSFIEATDKGLSNKTMRDRELINRYLAFSIFGEKKYKGYMDDYLSDALKHVNDLPSMEIERIRRSFTASMKINHYIFGKNAFRKHTPDSTRSVINASLFDVFSVLMGKVDEGLAFENADEIHEKFNRLMKDEVFIKSISLSTNSVQHVMKRFEIARNDFKGIIHD